MKRIIKLGNKKKRKAGIETGTEVTVKEDWSSDTVGGDGIIVGQYPDGNGNIVYEVKMTSGEYAGKLQACGDYDFE